MASRSFGNVAGTFSAMILFEYFRFETWAEQSGYLQNTEEALQIDTVPETGPRGLAGEYHTHMSAKAHEGVAQLLLTLKELDTLLQKYDSTRKEGKADDDGSNDVRDTSMTPPQNLSTTFKFGLDLGSKPLVRDATSDIERLRLRLGKETGRFRKIKFSWSVTKETTDRQRMSELIQQLKYWNDGLREILPIRDRAMTNALTQVRVVGLSESPYVLMGIEHACSHVQSMGEEQSQLYNDIRVSAKMKRESLESENEEQVQAPTPSAGPAISDKIALSESSDDPGGSMIIASTADSNHTKKLIAETMDFQGKIGDDEDIRVIEQRIKRLAWLLQDDERPMSLMIPISVGYRKEGRFKFTIIYEAPVFAVPSAGYRTLYSMFPRNASSVGLKAQPPVLPSLEDRIQLARTLAMGLLQLHSINWLHKNLNSANLLIFSTHAGPDVTTPMFAGFGLGRPSNPSTKTIDLRAVRPEFELYQHPELRLAAHRRYERRFDIYSLGMLFLEIGIWQSLHYFKAYDVGPAEFRRRVRNVAENLLPHLMGRKYCQVVVCCIDEDRLWKQAEGASELQEGTDGVFSRQVVQELHQCFSDL